MAPLDARQAPGPYPQRAQYPLNEEYTLNDRGLSIGDAEPPFGGWSLDLGLDSWLPVGT